MSVLEKLLWRQVVSFNLAGNNELIEVWEECDGCFSANLTKQEFGVLIGELQGLHSKMKEQAARGEGDENI